jgi:hypothetical protein
MAELWALLPADDAMRAMNALDALAAAVPRDDGRSADQRRADALTDALVGAVERSDRPGRPGGRGVGRGVHLEVTLGVGTLLGVDDVPAELAGYGPIPADLARAIAAEAASLRLLALDDSGVCVHAGATRGYRPDRRVAKTVIARDRICRFPGCRRPARSCDLDHTRPYPHGPTCPCNLAVLCRFHHRMKHRGGWTISHGVDGTECGSRGRDDPGGASDPPGTLTWTSPTGRRYATHPDPLPHAKPQPGRTHPLTPPAPHTADAGAAHPNVDEPPPF